jgi:hypothetical protein
MAIAEVGVSAFSHEVNRGPERCLPRHGVTSNNKRPEGTSARIAVFLHRGLLAQRAAILFTDLGIIYSGNFYYGYNLDETRLDWEA